MINENSFNSIFKNVIDFLKKSDLNRNFIFRLCNDLENSKGLIYRKYDSIRNHTKSTYMKNEDSYLDRHKCVAAFMIAFLTGLKFEECNEINHSILLKEKIVIGIGLTVLRSFVERDNQNYKNIELVNLLTKNDGFLLPPCICDKKSYETNWAKELHYAQKENKLSMLALSNQMFWIETYNKQLSEKEAA